MSINEMENKIRKMQEWEQLAADAKAEAEALRDEIKAEMLNKKTEEMTAGKFIVRWTSVLSNVTAQQPPHHPKRKPSAKHRGLDYAKTLFFC